MKKALITGITGQDGSYLAEFLLAKGYEVYGIRRRVSLFNTERIDHIFIDRHDKNAKFILYYGDITDSSSILNIIREVDPDEIYNLASLSHVRISFDVPEYTADANATGTLRVLEAIRTLKLAEKVKFYQASSSELYGKVQQVPQNEDTPFYPRSPYAVSKLFAYWITVNYREAYNIFAANGILFNHESPRRGEIFVTRKITRAIASILLGKQKKLYIGNIDAKRDWGHAKDYVEAMWLILQQPEPHDFVIATGISTSVRDFIRISFAKVGIKISFEGKGLNEKGIIDEINYDVIHSKIGVNNSSINLQHLNKGDVIIEIDPIYFRPTEVDALIGDSSKARKILGWKPKYNLDSLIEEMITEDIKKMKT